MSAVVHMLPLDLAARATDFPAEGDDQAVTLDNSEHRVFDADFAEMLRQDYPGVWRAGGNVLGNVQYRRLRPVVERGGEPKTPAEEEAIRLREAWGARHKDNHRLAGVVAQVKWFVVGARGQGYMKDLLREAMAKEDARLAQVLSRRELAEGATLCPPIEVRELVEASEETWPQQSLWLVGVAERICSGKLIRDDLHDMVAYGADEVLLGGLLGAEWAAEELERLGRATPMGWMVRRQYADTAEQRARYWHDWIRAVHRPSERRLTIALREYLAWWSGKVAERAPAVLAGLRTAQQRDISEEALEALLGSAEAAARLRRDLGPQLTRVVQRAFERAVRDMAMAGTLQFSPTLAPLDLQIGELIVQVTEATKRAVALRVNDAIANGLSMRDLQVALMDMPEFGRDRALRIARTETGRASTLGTNTALDVAAQQGARVQRQWITARDPAVRESHRRLDGEQVALGEAWLIGSGVATQGPGLSGVAEEDINCRCAVRPVIVRDQQ